MFGNVPSRITEMFDSMSAEEKKFMEKWRGWGSVKKRWFVGFIGFVIGFGVKAFWTIFFT